MTEQRRYDEDEVRRIFDEASSVGERDRGRGDVGSGEGLTLTELQSIGREVGLPPGRIADAAAALDRPDAGIAGPTILGVPLSVGRTVALPRAPTDREWELLVGELRQTFRAKGRVESYGTTREWWNGNLHARVEPTEEGHRLRLGTLKESARALTRGGGFLLALAAVLFVVGLLTGGVELDAPIILAAIGGGMLASSTLRLRAWAREREEQMERIAARARELLEPPPEA